MSLAERDSGAESAEEEEGGEPQFVPPPPVPEVPDEATPQLIKTYFNTLEAVKMSKDSLKAMIDPVKEALEEIEQMLIPFIRDHDKGFRLEGKDVVVDTQVTRSALNKKFLLECAEKSEALKEDPDAFVEWIMAQREEKEKQVIKLKKPSKKNKVVMKKRKREEDT